MFVAINILKLLSNNLVARKDWFSMRKDVLLVLG